MTRRHKDVLNLSKLESLSQLKVVRTGLWLPGMAIVVLSLTMLACGFIGASSGSTPNRAIRIHLPTLTQTPLPTLTPTPNSDRAVVVIVATPSSLVPPSSINPTTGPATVDITPIAGPTFTMVPVAGTSLDQDSETAESIAVETPSFARNESVTIDPNGPTLTATLGQNSGSNHTTVTSPAATPTETATLTPSATPTPLATSTPVPTSTSTKIPTASPTPEAPGGWSFASVRTHPDPAGSGLIYYGDLINNTGTAQELASITGIFFNDQDQVIAGDIGSAGYWPTEVIPPGARVPFGLTLFGVQNVADFDFSVEAEASSQTPRQDFELGDLNQSTPEAWAYCVAGRLQNTAGPLNDYLVIVVVLFDDQDNVVNFGDYYAPAPRELEDGQTLDFEVCVDPLGQEVVRHELRAWGQ